MSETPDLPSVAAPADAPPTVRAMMSHPTRTRGIAGLGVLASLVAAGVVLVALNPSPSLALVAAGASILATLVGTRAALRRYATIPMEATAHAEGLEMVEISRDGADRRAPRLVPWGDVAPPSEMATEGGAGLGVRCLGMRYPLAVPRAPDPAAVGAFAAAVAARVAAVPVHLRPYAFVTERNARRWALIELPLLAGYLALVAWSVATRGWGDVELTTWVWCVIFVMRGGRSLLVVRRMLRDPGMRGVGTEAQL